MTRSANRWLLITAASALALGMSACSKPASTDTSSSSTTAADTSAAPAAADTNAMGGAANNMAPSQ